MTKETVKFKVGTNKQYIDGEGVCHEAGAEVELTKEEVMTVGIPNALEPCDEADVAPSAEETPPADAAPSEEDTAPAAGDAPEGT